MNHVPDDDSLRGIRPPRRPPAYRDPQFRVLRNWLNIAFMLAAVATVVVYYAAPGPSGHLWFVGLGMTAVGIKMVEVVIRTLARAFRHHGRAKNDDEDNDD